MGWDYLLLLLVVWDLEVLGDGHRILLCVLRMIPVALDFTRIAEIKDPF